MSFYRRIYALILFCLALTQCSPVQDTSLFEAHLDIPALKSFSQSVTQTYPLPGMAVVVVTRDTAYYLTTGYSDLVRKIPFTDSTVFFAGGFSELLVASAALRLQEANRLNMQDPVVKALPYFQMQGDYQRISAHHLLTHTSGIPHFNPAWDMPAYEEEALEATTRSIIFQNVMFAPGSQCKRSPYNYDILADLMAKSEQKPFEEVAHAEILAPLGMHHSSFFPDTSSTMLARPHEILNWISYDLRESHIYPYTRENAGSFGLHATVGDMAKWMQMVLRTDTTNRSLSTASIDQLLATHYKTGENTYKGYGWEIIESEGVRVYNNSWKAGGFCGDLSLIPEKEMAVMVLSNTADDFNPTVISEHIMDHLAVACGVSGDRLRRDISYMLEDSTPFGMRFGGEFTAKWNVPKMFDRLYRELDIPGRRRAAAFNTLNRWKKRGAALVPSKFGIAFTANFMNRGSALVHL